jgi:hypothetical protein
VNLWRFIFYELLVFYMDAQVPGHQGKNMLVVF